MTDQPDSHRQAPGPHPIRPRHENIAVQAQLDRLEQAVVSFTALVTFAMLILSLSLPMFRVVHSDDNAGDDQSARLWTLWLHALAGEDGSRGAPDGGLAGLFLLGVLVLTVVALVIVVRQPSRNLGRRALIAAHLAAPLLLICGLILVAWMQRLDETGAQRDRYDTGPVLVIGPAVWWFVAGAIAFTASVWSAAFSALWVDSGAAKSRRRRGSDSPTGGPRVHW